jgi:putative ABC transport system permease protein
MHNEAIADRSMGLRLGDVVRLGRDDFTIVGIASGQVDMAGDPMIYLTVSDIQSAGFLLPSEAVLLNQQAKGRFKMGGVEASGISAVLVTLNAGADASIVQERIRRWGDVTVLTRDEQHEVLLGGRLYKLRIQILSFTVMTLIISCAVIALTVYTMTVEKTRQIALLKLIGARDGMITGMIMVQALIIGALSFALGVINAMVIFPYFPRSVLILPFDLSWIGSAFMILTLLASLFAIRKALSIRAQEVLS